MTKKEIQHLYWRSSFGIAPSNLEPLLKKSKGNIVKTLFSNSRSFSPLLIDTSEVENKSQKLLRKNKSAANELRKKNRQLIKAYNLAWIDRLIYPKELLRERMTLFWANHFVVRSNRILPVQEYNNVLRKYALGNFRDFVKAISKQPAMLKYLNNKQNRKKSPNENFARELMELFTLGKNKYTEQDIKESARAFTGHSYNSEGKFIIRKAYHDIGLKTFFNKTGNFNGDDIIDIILEKRQCARFICEKIYRHFVNDQLNGEHINEMVHIFYPDYDIERLMHFVFSSNWFYDQENIGTKIKSPIDYFVGLNRVVPIHFRNPKTIFQIQQTLGQTLLYPPNVAGWEGGRQWIDSNTILLRMRYASVFLNNGHITFKEENTMGASINGHTKKGGKKTPLPKTDPNWNKFNEAYENITIEELQEYLVLPEINEGTKVYLDKFSKSSKQDRCIQLMSIAEYQMC